MFHDSQKRVSPSPYALIDGANSFEASCRYCPIVSVSNSYIVLHWRPFLRAHSSVVTVVSTRGLAILGLVAVALVASGAFVLAHSGSLAACHRRQDSPTLALSPHLRAPWFPQFYWPSPFLAALRSLTLPQPGAPSTLPRCHCNVPLPLAPIWSPFRVHLLSLVGEGGWAEGAHQWEHDGNSITALSRELRPRFPTRILSHILFLAASVFSASSASASVHSSGESVISGLAGRLTGTSRDWQHFDSLASYTSTDACPYIAGVATA